MSNRVLLYYFFTQIDDPVVFAEEHRGLCECLGLKGRILIAQEGINGTCSGTVEACRRYRESLESDPRFKGIEFKVDESDGHVFKKLIVKVRPEIITLGMPVGSRKGEYLSPPEWKEALDADDVVIVDGRNRYESNLGRFKGAICPPLDNFREFPEWLEQHRDQFQGKRILTYCTGGIRCEKLSAWMLDAGFERVYQLHGGIVQYGKHLETQGEKFEGVNVVFDDRVVVPAGPKAQIVTNCRECGVISANYVNCANVECNIRIILCPDCELKTGRCCSEACRTAPRLRQKNGRLSETAEKR